GTPRDAVQQAAGARARSLLGLDATRHRREVARSASRSARFPGTRGLGRRASSRPAVVSLLPVDGHAGTIVGDTTRGPRGDVEPPDVGGVRALVQTVQPVPTIRRPGEVVDGLADPAVIG